MVPWALPEVIFELTARHILWISPSCAPPKITTKMYCSIINKAFFTLLGYFLSLGQTQWCSGITSWLYTQESWQAHGMLWIELKSASWKANTLPAVLWLWPLLHAYKNFCWIFIFMGLFFFNNLWKSSLFTSSIGFSLWDIKYKQVRPLHIVPYLTVLVFSFSLFILKSFYCYAFKLAKLLSYEVSNMLIMPPGMFSSDFILFCFVRVHTCQWVGLLPCSVLRDHFL